MPLIIDYLTDGHNIEFCESHVLFEYRKAQSWGKGGLSIKWPHVKQETAFRKLLTGNRTAELRRLDNFACIIERKWNKQLKRTEGE